MARRTKHRKFIEDRDLNQTDVSKGTGLNRGAVSNIVNDIQNINLETLKKLVIYYRCNPGDFLPWEQWIDEHDKKQQKAKK